MRNGFTLVEVMIIVVIVAIILTVSAPMLSKDKPKKVVQITNQLERTTIHSGSNNTIHCDKVVIDGRTFYVFSSYKGGVAVIEGNTP